MELRRRLVDAVPGLGDAVAAAAELLIDRQPDHASLRDIADPALTGLARAIATHPEIAGFLSRRSVLLERVCRVSADTLQEAEANLAGWRFADLGDLERCLDELRVLRREETVVAGCVHFAELVDFDAVSRFLSRVAETVTRRALELALVHARVEDPPPFAVIGMGKLAGMEFTYHSDLDLIFLTDGGAEAVHAASRIGQRLIAYLTTMTGAGVAYAVDTRLRPSGGQGTLVTTLSAFERYQCERAQTWEHLAMLRARAVAGETETAQATLERVRSAVLPGHASPWEELLTLRARVEKERGTDDDAVVSFKTGPGGLMDVDFLAGGGLLERGDRGCPALPSVPAMMRHAASGPDVERLLAHYAVLRRVEAAARWATGRGVEGLAADAASLEAAAVLSGVAPDGPALRSRLLETRRRIRTLYDTVASAGTIAALEGDGVSP
jgi:glutamate-ammonia-ligase adenylyltransferase